LKGIVTFSQNSDESVTLIEGTFKQLSPYLSFSLIFSEDKNTGNRDNLVSNLVSFESDENGEALFQVKRSLPLFGVDSAFGKSISVKQDNSNNSWASSIVKDETAFLS